MNFRNISAWAIRNPVAPIVLFIALTLAGIVSFMRMDVNNNPDISFPAAQVIVSQPGAAPTELETQVTQRVEAAVRGINGVDELSSFVSEGSSTTTVQFSIGTPVDRAVTDVREAVARIRSDLPEGILEPQVVRVDIDGGPIAYFSVEAVDMSLEQLSWFVDNTIAKRLLAVSGMAQVKRGGGVTREIRVILDPAKMQAQGITASQVNAQLRQTNVNAAGGRAEIAGSEQSVRVLGNAQDAYALGQKLISVGNGPHGEAVRYRRGARSLCRAAQPLEDGRPPGAELQPGQGEGLFRPDRLRRGDEGARQDQAAEPEDPLHPALYQRGLYQEPVSLGHRRDDRGRRARRVHRLPVPAGLARDADIGVGDPPLGHSHILADGLDGLHAERHQPARAESRRRRAGGRRDRGDREYRPPHAHGQDGLSGIDRCRRRDRPCGAGDGRWRSSRCSCRWA